MASLFQNSVSRKGKRKVYPNWYGSYQDEHGKWQKVKLYTDKTASQRRLNEIQRDAELRKAGVLTPIMDHAALGIARHLADYLEDLDGQIVTKVHRKNVETRLTEIITLAEWKRLADITADSMRRVLTTIGKRQVKGAKTPRTLTTSTVNSFLKFARAFVNWLVERGRLTADPLTILKKSDESKAEKRRARRALSGPEITALLAAAPPHRSFVYKFIMLTGLRRSEARFLLVGDLHLDATQPFIQLRTAQTKNGKADQLPVHTDLLEGLRDQIRGKMPGARVFTAIPEVRTLEGDLRRAGVAFVDELGRRVDLHAQRHTFCTLVAQSGATMKTAQTLMRHADPKLTSNVYSHVGIFDTAGALAGVTLPRIGTDAQADKKTGTTDTAEARWKHVGKTRFAKGHNRSQHGTTDGAAALPTGDDGRGENPLKLAVNVADSHNMAPHVLNAFGGAATLAEVGPHSSIGHAESHATLSKTAINTPCGNRLEKEPDRAGSPAAIDPQLQAVIDAWPTLAPDLRKMIVGVVKVSGKR